MQNRKFQVKVEKNVIYGFLALVVIFSAIIAVVGLSRGELTGASAFEVVGIAALGAGFHFLAQSVHMLGHMVAAQAVGYPKSGVWFMFVFAMSRYPADEPPLPDRTHIIRSLGGVVAFGLVLIFALWLWSNGQNAPDWQTRYLSGIILIDALLLFFVSAVVSDGVLFIASKGWRPSTNKP